MRFKEAVSQTQFVEKVKQVFNFGEPKIKKVDGARKRVYDFPDYRTCRQLFQKHLREETWEWN